MEDAVSNGFEKFRVRVFSLVVFVLGCARHSSAHESLVKKKNQVVGCIFCANYS